MPPAAAAPSPTPVEPVTETLHGVEITDSYRWLEDQNTSFASKSIGHEAKYGSRHLHLLCRISQRKTPHYGGPAFPVAYTTSSERPSASRREPHGNHTDARTQLDILLSTVKKLVAKAGALAMSKDGTSSRLLFWGALIRLLSFDLFTGRSFPRLHRVVRNWKVRPVAAPAGTTERVCKAINHACIWYPKHVLCLQRSYVTTCLLRSRGVPAQLVLGAQKAPFAAHAWVEVDGRAVNEERDVAAVYAVWEKC